ncbi:Type I secretion target repeat protein (fragment) [Planktothrix sp. PCC 11201]|uniref:calcium-binding protein n=1 Tax=Planktothrix sp. PCC 11201 TaxID=1729650 RepID=UPI00091747CF
MKNKSEFNLILGTNSPDLINGTSGQDKIFGRNGDDDIRPGEGNDIVHGGRGNDLIFGGGSTDAEDNDTLYGEQGDDRIFGQSGDDQIFGGIGNDSMGGDLGNDLLEGDSGNDTLDGGSGNDYLKGGPGDDLLLGNGGVQGVPSITYPSNDTLVGGAGNDTLDGVFDIVTGSSSGIDEIDILTGGGEKDTFILGKNQVYYDDGDLLSPGVKDYALIKDFQKHQDTIQLFGNSNDYVLGASPFHASDTGIFLDTNRNNIFDPNDELIGVVSDVKNLHLSGTYFNYVI